MPRTIALHFVFGLAVLPFAACSNGSEQAGFRQIPVDIDEWGAYRFEVRDGNLRYEGAVLVRGEQADALPGLDQGPGMESWWLTGVHGDSSASGLTLKLVLRRSPDDPELTDWVEGLEGSLLGEMAMVPQWSAEWSEPDAAWSLVNCDGPEGCEEELSQWALAWPAPSQGLPQFFGADEERTSLFGSKLPEEGDSVSFEWVEPGEPGFPTAGWLSYES